MPDSLSPQERSLRMALVKGRNTKPELVVRQIVHSLGYRYRLHKSELPGSPDLVFASRRKLIFVHGCFWHRHPDPKCKLARLPKSRLDFWLPKLESNRQRDIRVIKIASDMGWEPLVIWECELSDTQKLRNKLRCFLGEKS
jgi:DNA mismatch endonuclease (patch repair protein)